MTRPRWLAVFVVCFVAAFFWLRATSTFARVDARRDEARAVAAAVGLATEEVMALLDLRAGAMSAEALEMLARAVAAERRRLGDLGLAVAAAMGHAALVNELAQGVPADVARARLRARREGLLVERFATMVERYRALAPIDPPGAAPLQGR